MRRRAAAGWGLVFVLAAGCGDDKQPTPTPATPPAASVTSPTAAAPAEPLTYVGARTCAGCHAAAFEAWQGSHHDRAMQAPSPQTVLGTFDGEPHAFGEETFTFTRTPEGYFVDVAQAGAEPHRYPVRYTFGWKPLQQVLVDTGDGRLQALLVAWDARPAADGGQRWFHLQADQPAPPGDPLHWRAPAFTWNDACADCHSTGVNEGYDRRARRYDTTFAEVDVGCEACHGRGSRHVASARAGSGSSGPTPMPYPLVKPDTRAWIPQPDGPIARLQGTDPDDPELARCAPCHARRTALTSADDGGIHDRIRIALLDEGLYFPDGQIHDEVFVLGSFLQSKMHAAGVVCSDCHQPHGLALRAKGNALCGTCHRPEVFDTTVHHLHPTDSAGARCTACHMPQRTYMGVDDRADHRFGVPQPVLAARLGVPDPCLGCHPTQTPEQAAEAIGERPPRRPSGFGEALQAGRRGEPAASSLLLAVLSDRAQPGIARATALEQLGRNPSPDLLRALPRAVEDPDPLVRRAAAGLGEVLPPPLRDQLIVPLLDDPTRSVRLEAVGALVAAGPSPGFGPDTPRFGPVRDEYRRVQEASADRAPGLVSLARLARFEGNRSKARALLQAAIEREPGDLSATMDLVDLHRAAGRNADAEATLRQALPRVEDQATVQHALGLTLIRIDRREEALAQLEAAHSARPDVARYGYVYAVALHDAGRGDEALAVLEAVHDRHPTDPEVLGALADYAARLGRPTDARRYRAALDQLRAEP